MTVNTDDNSIQLSDKRMLLLIDKLKAAGRIRFRQEFCDAIEIPKQNIRNIRNGTQHFTVAHIGRACKKYQVNANWILGIEKNVWRL